MKFSAKEKQWLVNMYIHAPKRVFRTLANMGFPTMDAPTEFNENGTVYFWDELCISRDGKMCYNDLPVTPRAFKNIAILRTYYRPEIIDVLGKFIDFDAARVVAPPPNSSSVWPRLYYKGYIFDNVEKITTADWADIVSNRIYQRRKVQRTGKIKITCFDDKCWTKYNNFHVVVNDNIVDYYYKGVNIHSTYDPQIYYSTERVQRVIEAVRELTEFTKHSLPNWTMIEFPKIETKIYERSRILSFERNINEEIVHEYLENGWSCMYSQTVITFHKKQGPITYFGSVYPSQKKTGAVSSKMIFSNGASMQINTPVIAAINNIEKIVQLLMVV